MTAPRIAIPEPTSLDSDYNSRSLPAYIFCLRSAGSQPVIIPLHERPDRVARLLAGTQGVLLPGARYDVDPQIYGEERISECGQLDPSRSAADELLLQDAFNLRKPILGICYGAQSLNVWCSGSLVQDLPAQGWTQVNHAPGREVVDAHRVRLVAGSRLERLAGKSEVSVNSSHHQAIRRLGDNLSIAAEAPDGLVEAVELNSAEHWVMGVQWHPERTYAVDEFSRKIFGELVAQAQRWTPKLMDQGAAAR